VGEISFVDHSTVKLVGNFKETPTDLMVCKAAWVSSGGMPDGFPDEYMLSREDAAWYSERDDVKDAKKRMQGLINFLYRNRHMSPFEHGSFPFYIETPIFVAREFMRHRTFSYNETSGRYKELEGKFFLIDSERPLVQSGKTGAYTFLPGDDDQYGTVFAETTLANKRSWDAYQKMLAAGVAREVARNVLPVNIMTSFYVTGNPRNWMQFFTLRNDKNALQEIRKVAAEIEDVFAKAMPMTYAAYKQYDWRDERAELEQLRATVAQIEAFETYEANMGLELGSDERRTRQTELIKSRIR
jgi:thymidylate synthase (FAD)